MPTFKSDAADDGSQPRADPHARCSMERTIDVDGAKRSFATYAILARRSAKAVLRHSAIGLQIIIYFTHQRDTLVRPLLWFPCTVRDVRKTRVFQLKRGTMQRASRFDGMIWQGLPHLRLGTH